MFLATLNRGEIGIYFVIKGPPASGVIKGIQGWLDEEKKIRTEKDCLKINTIMDFEGLTQPHFLYPPDVNLHLHCPAGAERPR